LAADFAPAGAIKSGLNLQGFCLLKGMESLSANALPDDVETLKAMLAERLAEVTHLRVSLAQRDARIEKLLFQLAQLKRMQFGQRSEKLAQQIEQLELQLEELLTPEPTLVALLPETAEPEAPAADGADAKRRPSRRPLPAHLPRHEQVYAPAADCPDCGGTLRPIGEDVSEMLDYVPARFRVIRHVRPKCVCDACERIVQADAPSRPIARGTPSPGLLAQVLIAKFADHLPLYRQCEIYARDGVELERSTLGDWVGRASVLLQPLVECIGQHVMAGHKLHADDTPVPVLAPGRGKTAEGRLWTYVRDDRPAGFDTAPAVLFRFSPNRRGEHPKQHLASFKGALQADGYAGFHHLYGDGKLQEVACWAHVRRKFFDIHKANASPIAHEILERIATLYAIEASIRGQPADARRQRRQTRAGPLIDALKSHLQQHLQTVSAKSTLAEAIRYALNRWPALRRYIDDGRLEIDNNTAERALRTVAVGRKNWLFAGSDAGGERAANLYTLIGTAKLNGVEPYAWLRDVLERIAYAWLRDVLERIAEHPINRIHELLPWNVATLSQGRQPA